MLYLRWILILSFWMMIVHSLNIPSRMCRIQAENRKMIGQNQPSIAESMIRRRMRSTTTSRTTNNHPAWCKTTTTKIMMMNENFKDDDSISSTDDLILQSSQTLQRFSWLSWWSQVILTVVSSVTLLFARNVRRLQILRSNGSVSGGSGLILAGMGIIVSFLSILWTWGGARLGRKLATPKHNTTGRISAANMIRRVLTVGISINVIGMALALLGAEQIVGGLAIQVLSQQGGLDRTILQQSIQPLDILTVQGNTNTLLSHFGSLVAYLYQTKLVRQLDPPSTVGDIRK
jgi:Protein of unknown function (DUF3611)